MLLEYVGNIRIQIGCDAFFKEKKSNLRYIPLARTCLKQNDDIDELDIRAYIFPPSFFFIPFLGFLFPGHPFLLLQFGLFVSGISKRIRFTSLFFLYSNMYKFHVMFFWGLVLFSKWQKPLCVNDSIMYISCLATGQVLCSEN